MNYQRPSGIHRTYTTVSNSQFICTINQVCSAVEAREFLAIVRAEMPDASHHVYAFRVGYGNSVVEGMSDDGEPSGTAGPPVLAVLRGTQSGDIIIVITRYFGGIKLGTGGLVRAYTKAAQNGLATLKLEYNIIQKMLGVELPYPLYEPIKRLIQACKGTIEDESFDILVMLIVRMPLDSLKIFRQQLNELSAGQVNPIEFD